MVLQNYFVLSKQSVNSHLHKVAGLSRYRLLLLLNTGLLLCISSWACKNWLDNFLLCYLILIWKRTVVNANANQRGADFMRVGVIGNSHNFSILHQLCVPHSRNMFDFLESNLKFFSIRRSYYHTYLLLYFLCLVCPAHIYYSWWRWGRREWRQGVKEDRAG